MKEYERLTNEELNDFTSRVVVQLEPTLTQQIISLILELTEYRTKIENGTLIELNKPYIILNYVSNGKEYYSICMAKEEELHINLTKAEAEARLEELKGEV